MVEMFEGYEESEEELMTMTFNELKDEFAKLRSTDDRKESRVHQMTPFFIIPVRGCHFYLLPSCYALHET